MVLEDRWLRETYVDLLIEYAAKNSFLLPKISKIASLDNGGIKTDAHRERMVGRILFLFSQRSMKTAYSGGSSITFKSEFCAVSFIRCAFFMIKIFLSALCGRMKTSATSSRIFDAPISALSSFEIVMTFGFVPA